jgi:hypothetical protein
MSETTLLLLKFAFAASMYLVVNPYLFDLVNLDQSQGVEIGKIIRVNGKSLIQYPSEIDWHQSKEKLNVHNHDRIFADAGALVEIQFNDKSKLVVEENSLIAINQKTSGNEYILENGRAYIEMHPGQGIVLQNGDFLVARQTSTVYIENLGNDFLFQVPIGKVNILNRNNKQLEPFLERQSLAETNGRILPVSPSGPVALDQKTPVEFSWFWNGSPLQWTLEISQDPDFQSDSKKYFIGKQQNTKVLIPAGNWHWRVSGQRRYAEKVYMSPTRALQLSRNNSLFERKIASLPIQLDLNPAPYEISFKFIEDIRRTMVRWLYDKPSERYHLTVGCKKTKETDLEIYAGQKFAALDLEAYDGCKMQIRSFWPNSTSGWSQKVIVPSPPQPVRSARLKE